MNSTQGKYSASSLQIEVLRSNCLSSESMNSQQNVLEVPKVKVVVVQ